MMNVEMLLRISSVSYEEAKEVRDRAHVALGEAGVPRSADADAKQGDAEEAGAWSWRCIMSSMDHGCNSGLIWNSRINDSIRCHSEVQITCSLPGCRLSC